MRPMKWLIKSPLTDALIFNCKKKKLALSTGSPEEMRSLSAFVFFFFFPSAFLLCWHGVSETRLVTAVGLLPSALRSEPSSPPSPPALRGPAGMAVSLGARGPSPPPCDLQEVVQRKGFWSVKPSSRGPAIVRQDHPSEAGFAPATPSLQRPSHTAASPGETSAGFFGGNQSFLGVSPPALLGTGTNPCCLSWFPIPVRPSPRRRRGARSHLGCEGLSSPSPLPSSPTDFSRVREGRAGQEAAAEEQAGAGDRHNGLKQLKRRRHGASFPSGGGGRSGASERQPRAGHFGAGDRALPTAQQGNLARQQGKIKKINQKASRRQQPQG